MLSSRRIIITRPRGQAESLARLLVEQGAEPILLPTIETAPPASWRALDDALSRLEQFQGYIFTSANGVQYFFSRAAALGLAPRPAAGSWICAIGPATASQLAVRGWPVDTLPERYLAEGIVEALTDRPLAGARILIPRAAQARDLLPRELARAGAYCEVVAAYQTRIPQAAAELARALFPPPPEKSPADAVLFTSSSTAQHLAAILGADFARRLQPVARGAIGPITAATLSELGLAADFIAAEYTAAGLVRALVEFFQSSIQKR